MSSQKSESRVMSEVRLRAAELGYHLFRNNVGQLLDKEGRPVRFGLANDSKALNKALKSGDLIGWETITITPDMVGQRVARFLSVEVKAEDWRPDKSERYAAQSRWVELVNNAGGRARILTAASQLIE